PEAMPLLFDRFYRADAAGQPGGLGLGLYIGRMLVEAHGGRIRAESRPGGGSVFTVALPMTAEG
ncbi:MAG: sensor histidine kinase, partial [Chloroflexota bacterium]|nr:sensor histidine kinase [Chloroflexota bacterium]